MFKFDKAYESLFEALKIRKEIYGPVHAEVANVHFNLGIAYYFESNLKDSEKQWETCLNIQQQIFARFQHNFKSYF